MGYMLVGPRRLGPKGEYQGLGPKGDCHQGWPLGGEWTAYRGNSPMALVPGGRQGLGPRGEGCGGVTQVVGGS